MEKVNFLDTSVYRLCKNSPLYTEALRILHSSFKLNGNPPIFPGPQPVSIERRHIPLLRKDPYVVCEKTDGVRFVFISFKHNGKRICTFVNRNLEFYVVPVKIMKDTVLDGEVVKCNDGKWVYMVYDAVCDGDFSERYSVAKSTISKIMKVATDPIRIILKSFYPIDDIKTLCNYQFPYITDGLVFTPINEPIKIGTHETMFKWKPLAKNTIDFQMKLRHDGKWGMYLQEKGALIYETETEIGMCDSQFYKEDIIVECMYMPEHNNMWLPIKIREDKNFPNARRTFWRTMINLREDVQIHEFL